MKLLLKTTSVAGLSLFLSLTAFADYNCNVYIKQLQGAYTPFEVYNYDVPDFRTSGTSKFGYNSFAEWLHFLPAGGLIADAALNSPNRWRNCMDQSMKRSFTGNSYNTIFDGIFSKQGVNAKVNFCMQPGAMERGEGGYMSKGLEFEFKAQKVTNRSKWGYQTTLIMPPKSYCAEYYEDECFAPVEAPEPEVDAMEPLDGEAIEELFEDSESAADTWEPGSNTEAPPPPPPPEYCEAKPFELFDETPDEAWTEAGKSALFPVDINGDFLSDIVMRTKDSQGQVLRTKLSNGDGTFTPIDYRSGEKFLDTFGVLAGYFNDDAKTDLLLRDREAGVGMIFYTKLSNGDGTFESVRHVDGDEKNKRSRYGGPAMVGDVDGDRLSDIVITYQHPTEGLQVAVKFSNGDGTFRSNLMSTGEANPQYARYHLADINKDNKSDLVITHARGHDLQIRSYISNGDGTFERKDYNSGVWFNRDKFQSFVADLNRDKRTDIVLLHRTPDGDLFANTYMGNGDGTFNKNHQHFTNGEDVDQFDAVVADVNGDRRSDIVLRRRDAGNGLVIISKTSNGDGTFASHDFQSGDGAAVDAAPMFVGNYNRGMQADLGLRYSNSSQGNMVRMKMGASTNFTPLPTDAPLGNQPYQLNPITGPMRWSGGGTFNPRRPSTGTAEAASANQAVISMDPVTSGGLTGSSGTGAVSSETSSAIKPANELTEIKKVPAKVAPRTTLKRGPVKNLPKADKR